MRDGNVPHFFVRRSAAGKAQLVGQLAVQMQLTAQLADPAKQDPAVPAFHDIAGAGRKGKETDGREDRKRG